MYRDVKKETIQKLISEAFNKEQPLKEKIIETSEEDIIIYLQEQLIIAEGFIKKFGQFIAIWKAYEERVITNKNNISKEMGDLILITRDVLAQALIEEYGDCVICAEIDKCENATF